MFVSTLKSSCKSSCTSVASRRGLGGGREAYLAISGIIYGIETLEESISVDEVKALARVRTDLFGSN